MKIKTFGQTTPLPGFVREEGKERIALVGTIVIASLITSFILYAIKKSLGGK